MPSISVITPTCNRPVTFALLERWMARQTLAPTEWIVVDGGQVPVRCTLGQMHLHQPAPPGVANFHANLERGIQAATGDLIIIMEDDDWYASTHLETMVAKLVQPEVTIAGDDQQRYYNLEHCCWRHMQNRGAALCQTGFHRALVPTFLDVIAGRRARVHSANPTERTRAIGVDAYLWQSQPRSAWALTRMATVVGMKGLPGQPARGWTPDPDGRQLQAWVGAQDQALYTHLGLTPAPDVE
jgi:glycosyltransferase involved in cell wall biosynthesis